MDKWILKGARNLVKEDAVENINSPTQVKVKVTHLLLSNFDAITFDGANSPNYPVVPGRFAIGIVTDVGEACYGVERGSRVYLESAKCCGKCISCKSGKPDLCRDIQIAGRDYNGFMRDFVVCEYTDVAVLPDSVDNLHALCIETVGLAENIYDKLNLSAGQRVAVVGCDFTGNIIAQVLQYHKVIPVVIDSNPKNIEKVKKCGIAYGFAADDELHDNVFSITSGEMCDAAIYSCHAHLPSSLPLKLVGNSKHVVLAGFSPMDFTFDAKEIIKKDLTVSGVTNGYEYTHAVINMLVHGAIDVEPFEKDIIRDYNPVAMLTERCENLSTSNRGRMTVIKMIL